MSIARRRAGWLCFMVLVTAVCGTGCYVKITTPTTSGTGGASSGEGGSAGDSDAGGGAGGSSGEGGTGGAQGNSDAAAPRGISNDCKSCAVANCLMAITGCSGSPTCVACVDTNFAACIGDQNTDYLAVCQCTQGNCPVCAPFCP